MICPKCKAENTDGAIFCSKCGEKLKNVEKSEEKKQIVSIAVLLAGIILFVVGVAAGLYFFSPGRSICAKCGKEFSGTKYQNVIVGDGTGVLCEDCAGYEYGADMNRYKQ